MLAVIELKSKGLMVTHDSGDEPVRHEDCRSCSGVSDEKITEFLSFAITLSLEFSA